MVSFAAKFHAPSRLATWPLILLPAAVAIVWRGIVAAQEAMAGFLVDDAYISLRHARHFVDGHGFTYNAGERIEGYTNFLWTALAAIPHALGTEVEAFMQALGIASAVGLVAALAVLAKRYGGWLAAVAMAATLACDDRLIGFAVWGLEITFYPMLCAWALVALVAGRPVLSGLVFGLAAMTRMEALLLVAAAGLFLLARERFNGGQVSRAAGWREWLGMLAPASKFSISFLSVFGTYFIARWTYYSYLLPNTFYAKVGSPKDSLVRGFEYLGKTVYQMNLTYPIIVAALLASIVLVREVRKHGRPSIPVGVGRGQLGAEYAFWASATLLYVAYVLAVGGDHIPTFGPRFMYHMLPVLLVALTLMLATGLSLAPRPVRWFGIAEWRTVRVIAGVLGASLPLALTHAPMAGGAGGWASNGLWIKQNTPPGALIATGAAGALPYHAERRTIDMFGMANIHIAHTDVPDMGRGPAAHEKRDPRYVLQQAPDIIASWMNDAGHLGRGLRERFAYRANYRTIGVLDTPGRELDPEPLRILPATPDARRPILSDRQKPHWGVAERRDEPRDTIVLHPEDVSTDAENVTIGGDGTLARAQPRSSDTPILSSIEMYFEPARYTWTFAMRGTAPHGNTEATCRAKVWRHDHDGFTDLGRTVIRLEGTGRTRRGQVSVDVLPAHIELGHGVSVSCDPDATVRVARIAVTKRP